MKTILVFLFFLAEAVVGEEEDRVVVGCGIVSLVCGEGKMVVTTAASFTPLSRGEDRRCSVVERGENNEYIWRSVVEACSGRRGGSCNFNLVEKLPETKAWGLGRIEV